MTTERRRPVPRIEIDGKEIPMVTRHYDPETRGWAREPSADALAAWEDIVNHFNAQDP